MSPLYAVAIKTAAVSAPPVKSPGKNVHGIIPHATRHQIELTTLSYPEVFHLALRLLRWR
jgi:hypothetical protein